MMKLLPLSLPWMLSPSGADLRVQFSDERTLVSANVATLIDDVPHATSVLIVFQNARWVNIHPVSDNDDLSIGKRFSWEEVPSVDVNTVDGRYHDSSVYEVADSSWATRLVSAHSSLDGFKHYVLSGPDSWVEIFAASFSWILDAPRVHAVSPIVVDER